MSAIDIIFLSTALAMDCFAVSIVSGVSCGKWMMGLMIRMAILFGVFQAAMPLAGWLGISFFASYLEAVDHWIAFGLLAYLGGRMIREAVLNHNKDDDHHAIPSALTTQLILAVATSIDALAVGISLGCIGYIHLSQLTIPLMAIGVGSFLFSIAGNMLGIRFGAPIRRRINPELLGGIILVFIGIKVLLSHLIIN